MNYSQLQNHWSTTGCNQGRNNQCPSQQQSSGNYIYQGCFNDNSIRAIPNQQSNVSSINDCQQIALSKNQNVFGLQNGNQCFTGENIQASYQYGSNFSKSACGGGNMGGSWTNQVYALTNPLPPPPQSVPILSSSNFGTENFSNILEEESKREYNKNIIEYLLIIIVIILLIFFIYRMLQK
jgi:predicted nucleic acid-binding Zn ribbon protein